MAETNHRLSRYVVLGALLVYVLTLSRSITLQSLPLTAQLTGWDWLPMTGGTEVTVSVGVARADTVLAALHRSDEALRVGLVQAVGDPVLEHAFATARLVAAKSPAALRAAKALVPFGVPRPVGPS